MQRHTWRVWKNGSVAGYVSSYEEWDVVKLARRIYGYNIIIEKLTYERLIGERLDDDEE